MALGRQRDHTRKKALIRKRRWRNATIILLRDRATRLVSTGISSALSLHAATHFVKAQAEFQRYNLRRNALSTSQFSFNFNALTDYISLNLFRFRKADIARMITAINWPDTSCITSRNRYRCDPTLVTCVILRRLCSPARWTDMELFFGRHASQLSEVFWEGIEQFVSTRVHLLTGDISATFLSRNAERYELAVAEAGGALENCISFIDGTVIGIARPGDHEQQNVAYNGHKRKHALKYQAVKTPDGLILHVHGPIEGRRHDWTLYVRSGLDESLQEIMVIDGIQYVIYGDSGYNIRPFMEVPFQGANILTHRHAFNKAMSKVRVTVEWIFKEMKLYWTTVNFKRKMRIGESPVGALYITAILLTNMRNCTYPNTISQFFKCSPPSLEEYLTQKD